MARRIFSWIFLFGIFVSGTVWAAEGCTLNRVVGDVNIIRGGQTLPAKEKDSLKKGDLLTTGTNCMSRLISSGSS